MEENKQHKTALPETEPIPSAQAPEALLDIRGLRVEYHTDEDVVYAVNGLDLTIGKGESLGLVGETGAGKTTTALSVLRLIADAVRAAHERDRWVGICGGLGADPQAVPVLVGLGVDELSVTVPTVPAVKSQVRELSFGQCQELAQRALRCDAAEGVRRLIPAEEM